MPKRKIYQFSETTERLSAYIQTNQPKGVSPRLAAKNLTHLLSCPACQHSCNGTLDRKTLEIQMTSIHHIFVYGTLCQGQCRETLWPAGGVAIHPGFVRGALYDLGPYPAVIEGDDWVAGELHCYQEPDLIKTLSVLDQIEGYVEGRRDNLYERIVVPFHRTTDPAAATIPTHIYQMKHRQLPHTARRIGPRQHANPAQPYCRWPDDARTTEERQQLPDPFPGW